MITIEELTTIAEEVYGNDNNVNEKDSLLWEFKECVKCLESLILSKVINTTDTTLSKVEILSIVVLLGNKPELIQMAAFNPNKSNKFTKKIVGLLDSALLKVPKCTEPVLYRMDSYDNAVHEEKENICIKGFFTTSKDDFDNTNSIKWIITPLPPEKTKAHEIYRVYNHGYDRTYPEYQIEFERGSSFTITKIEDNDRYRTIYINELDTK